MKNLIYIVILSVLPMLTYAQIDVVAPNGDVGIGTASPNHKLDVDGNANVRGNFLNVGEDAGATAAYLRVGSGRTANGIAAIDCIGKTAYPLYGFRFGYTGAGSSVMFHRGTSPFLIQATEAANIYFRTASTNRVAITSTGRVGIGTTAPAGNTLLDVKGAIGYNGTLVNTSDKRLKTNEEKFAYGLNEILSLSPIYYNYTGKAGTNAEDTHVGIYAQDLRKVAPKLVSEFTYEEVEIDVVEDEIGMEVTEKVKKSPETYLNINESSIKYMLINAVKEQQALIDLQNKKMVALEEKVEALLNNSNNTPSSSQTVEFGTSGQLLQNQPNPFNEATTIKYTLPQNTQNAQMQIADMNGRVIKTVELSDTQNGELILKAGELSMGTYSYSLIVDGQILSTKKMILTK